jgi:single-strand DNA-binding protein
MLNRWQGIGNATATPEMKYTGSNIGYVQFNVACDRPFENAQGQKETDFVFVVAWRELAEVMVKYLRVGRKIYVEGRLQIRNYEDDQGIKRYVTEVIAEKIDFLDSPPEETNNNNGQQGQSQGNNRGYQNQGSSQGKSNQGNYQGNSQGNNNQGNSKWKNKNYNKNNSNQGSSQGNYQRNNNQGGQYQSQNQSGGGGRMPWE